MKRILIMSDPITCEDRWRTRIDKNARAYLLMGIVKKNNQSSFGIRENLSRINSIFHFIIKLANIIFEVDNIYFHYA